jgi:hypothetical protein
MNDPVGVVDGNAVADGLDMNTKTRYKAKGNDAAGSWELGPGPGTVVAYSGGPWSEPKAHGSGERQTGALLVMSDPTSGHGRRCRAADRDGANTVSRAGILVGPPDMTDDRCH